MTLMCDCGTACLCTIQAVSWNVPLLPMILSFAQRCNVTHFRKRFNRECHVIQGLRLGAAQAVTVWRFGKPLARFQAHRNISSVQVEAGIATAQNEVLQLRNKNIG